MSVYSEVAGTLHLKNEEDYEKARSLFKENGYLNENDTWLSDGDIAGEGGNDPKDGYFTMDGGLMRNIGTIVKHITDNYEISEKTVLREMCTDGTFYLREYQHGLGTMTVLEKSKTEKIIGCKVSDILYEAEDEESNQHIVAVEENCRDWLYAY